MQVGWHLIKCHEPVLVFLAQNRGMVCKVLKSHAFSKLWPTDWKEL